MNASTKAPFRFWSFFFSLKGRVSRRPILAIILPVHLFFWGESYAWRPLVRAFARAHPNDAMAFANLYMAIAVATGIPALAMFWPMFALPFKRLHDANLSGLFATPYFLPFAAGWGADLFHALHPFTIVPYFHGPYYLWTARIISWAVAIVPALLPGTKGANRFGPPPGQLAASVEDVF